MRLGNSENILIEEEERWQKIIMPAEKSTPLFIFYSIAMILWAVSTVWLIYQLFQPLSIDRPFTTNLVFRLIWISLLVTWYWFAKRFLWGFWQYYAANREILFINKEEFIIRRPVSLLGVTNVYDMKHIESLYYDDEKGSPTLQYGVQPVQFGQALSKQEGIELVSLLSHRHFPHLEDEEEF
jgi:hypothetical protein